MSLISIKVFFARRKKAYSKGFKTTVRQACREAGKEFSPDVLKAFRRDYLKYHIPPDEIVRYDLFSKSEDEKREYMSFVDEGSVFFLTDNNKFPTHKYKRSQLFKGFFHRDMIYVSSSEEEAATEDEYRAFCDKHDRFIIKPIDGREGHGVQIIAAAEVPTIAALCKSYGDDLLLEELIEQGDALAQFHPSSINTLRFVSTLNAKGEFTILYTLFRAGMGGSVVDNVGSGGLIAMVDPKTGVICSDAVKGAKHYAKHPDTNVTYQGFAMPEWEKLCETAERAHRLQPDQKLIGWDFAWTAKGEWDLVEANPCPSFVSFQALTGRGIRPTLRAVGILD